MEKLPAMILNLIPPHKKCKVVVYHHERAFCCVMSDYLGPVPRFPDMLFEQMLRIKRSMVDIMLNNLAWRDSFWTTTYSRSGKPSINPYVNQKTICFGVSCFAFTDYFQMGESTIHKCVSRFCRGLVSCPELSEIYLQKQTKSNAHKIVATTSGCPQNPWYAWLFGCNKSVLEELSHCFERSIPREGEICCIRFGSSCWLQSMVSAFIIWVHGLFL